MTSFDTPNKGEKRESNVWEIAFEGAGTGGGEGGGGRAKSHFEDSNLTARKKNSPDFGLRWFFFSSRTGCVS